MTRPRFLANHDINEHIIRGVCRVEPLIEFQKVRDLGMEQSTDEEILEYAAAQLLIVVSHDVSTMSAAAITRLVAGQPLAGLLLALQETPIGDVIESLVMIWAASEAEEWINQIHFVPL